MFLFDDILSNVGLLSTATPDNGIPEGPDMGLVLCSGLPLIDLHIVLSRGQLLIIAFLVSALAFAMFSHVDTYRPWYIFPSILAALLSFYSSWPQQLFSATVLKFNPAPTNPHVIHERTRVSYLGTTENGVEQFESIFYAEDTSGPNRFMPPMPYAPPSGTFVDVTALGAACPQGLGPAALPFTSPVTNVSENCLSLRVARPAGVNASAKLPVLVWIHGGMLMAKCSMQELRWR